MGRSTCVLVLGAIACDQGHAKAPPPAAHRDASATIAPTVAPTLALDGRSPDARSPDAALPQGTLYIGYPRGLVVQGDDLYFGDTGEDAQLRRMPKRGGATIVLGSDEGVYGSSGLAVSGADVFWGGELGLKKLAKTGGNVVELDHVATRRGPIVDATSVYWFTQAENEPPYLMAMPLGGGKPRRVARGSASSFVVQGMAVDDSQVYWVDDSQHVFAAPKHGGATRTLLALWNPGPDSAAGPFRSAIAVDRDSVYAGFPLLRIPTHGGKVRVLDEQLGDCSAIAIGRDVIYVAIHGSLVSYPKAGGPPTTITTTDINNDNTQLAIDDTHIYWTTLDSIRGSPLR